MDRLTLSFIFGLGIVVQTLLFVMWCPAEGRLGRIGIAAATGLFGLLPGKHERNYELHFHICYCFVVYAFMIFVLFKKEIMARVSESSLLGNSLVFWYLCASYFTGTPRQNTLMAIAALPTLITLVIAFTIREWHFVVRLSCYIWFLCLMLAISCFQVHFGNMSFIWSDRFSPPAPFSLFLTGMAFTYLTASVFYIFILIPFTQKHQTFAQRMVIWRKDAHLMASYFSDYQLSASQALSILVFQGGLYVLNYFFRWVSVPVMMNLTLIVLPYFFAIFTRLVPSSLGPVPTDKRSVP